MLLTLEGTRMTGMGWTGDWDGDEEGQSRLFPLPSPPPPLASPPCFVYDPTMNTVLSTAALAPFELEQSRLLMFEQVVLQVSLDVPRSVPTLIPATEMMPIPSNQSL